MKPGAINDPADCCICRRHAWSLGVNFLGRERYVCLECAEMAEQIKRVKRAHMNFYEEHAREEAGDAGGAYLDTIGKTDLATLEADEYHKFVETIVFGFGDSMRKQISGFKAPF